MVDKNTKQCTFFMTANLAVRTFTRDEIACELVAGATGTRVAADGVHTALFTSVNPQFTLVKICNGWRLNHSPTPTHNHNSRNGSD